MSISFKERKLSSFVDEQLPEFIRSDRDNFVSFIKAYYEFLEQKKGPLNETSNLLSYLELSNTVDEYVDFFINEIATSFPQEIVANKERFASMINRFYKDKGTEESYKFLFRAIYGEEIELYIPSVDILRASDGKWIKNNIIRLSEDPRLLDSVGLEIRGLASRTTATIDNISNVKLGNYFSDDVVLTNITGDFFLDEIVRVYRTEDDFFEIFPFSVIQNIDIVNGGTGYTINDVITITDPTGNGKLAEVKISSVNSEGTIRNIEIENFGVNYDITSTVSVSGGNSDAVLDLNIGYVGTTTGEFLNSDGHLSSNKYIQDSNFYQDYSYVIRSGLPIESYRKTLKKLIHPAGIALFGQVLIKNIINASTVINTNKIVQFIQSLINRSINVSTNQLRSIGQRFYNLIDNTYIIGNTNYIVSSSGNKLTDRLGEITNYQYFTLEDLENYLMASFNSIPDSKSFVYAGSNDINDIINTNREELKLDGIGELSIGNDFIVN